MPFDRIKLLDRLDPLFAGNYKQSQKDGMDAILSHWEKHWSDVDLRWLAYMLATTFHETNQQMQPVREAYWVRNAESWRQANLAYYPYYGRGFVQLTHKANYDKAGKVVGRDLVNQPDLALEPDIACTILFAGMKEGWFRGDAMGPHTLGRYFSAKADDPVGARAIINGIEYKKVNHKKVLMATTIAHYHEAFLDALQHS